MAKTDHNLSSDRNRFWKSLRNRSTWILMALFLLPVLAFSVWFNRQVRQKNLDHALIEAIKKGDTPVAISLLDAGADANARDKPYKPLTLKSLLADCWNRMKGKKPPQDTQVYPPALLLPHKSGVFPLWDRDLRDNPKLIKALLEHGANPYATDRYGYTLLLLAAMYDHTATVRTLLQHHVDPNRKNTLKLTVHPSNREYDWETVPLIMAQNKSARLLLEYGAAVNAQDIWGNTALRDACLHHDADKVHLLLQHGAKVSIRNIIGSTPLDYAEEMEYKDLIPLLKNALRKEQAEQKSSSRTATK